MMVPDYALIGEIACIFGFEAAVSTRSSDYKAACSGVMLLPKHYDYGMRAVNSILVACGNRLKVGDDPPWDEAKVAFIACDGREFTKVHGEDVLSSGMSDLFPEWNYRKRLRRYYPDDRRMCWSGVKWLRAANLN